MKESRLVALGAATAVSTATTSEAKTIGLAEVGAPTLAAENGTVEAGRPGKIRQTALAEEREIDFGKGEKKEGHDRLLYQQWEMPEDTKTGRVFDLCILQLSGEDHPSQFQHTLRTPLTLHNDA